MFFLPKGSEQEMKSCQCTFKFFDIMTRFIMHGTGSAYGTAQLVDNQWLTNP